MLRYFRLQRDWLTFRERVRWKIHQIIHGVTLSGIDFTATPVAPLSNNEISRKTSGLQNKMKEIFPLTMAICIFMVYDLIVSVVLGDTPASFAFIVDEPTKRRSRSNKFDLPVSALIFVFTY